MVSVIIVSYGVRELLARCLKGLGSGSPVCEIIVVDNGSPDGSAQMVRERFPEVELITWSDNRGFAAAVNAGARRARGELLLLLNPDTEVPPGAVEQMRQRLLTTGAAALGVRQVDPTGLYQLALGPGPNLGAELVRKAVQWRLDRRDRWLAAAVDRLLARPRVVPWVAGSCLMVRRAVFRDVGGFDEGYFLYFEDIDFCQRLGQAGHRVLFDPTITIIHRRGQSVRTAPAAARRAYRRSQLRYWRQYRGPGIAALVRGYLWLRGEAP